MKELPIGMQTFKELIEGGYVYADKTKFVYNIVRTGKAYFLSRPRRFGKSLLLSTFEALFNGPPEHDGPPQGLFSDLWIGRETDYDFKQAYPVITLNMDLDSSTPTNLRDDLKDMLRDLGNSYSLKISGAAPGRMLANLITSLNKKHNQRVVLLIDEYDAPVSDSLHDFDLAQANRDILKNFYSNLKSCDKYLRFVFVTGVTRYAFMGLSAGLNQLIDLTLDKEYSDICGFTHDEFKSCFAEHFSKALNEVKKRNILPFKATVSDLQKKILDMYDGYSWDGVTKVLNPFSLLCFFRNFYFNAFWMNQDPSAKLISALVAKDPLAFTDDKLRELSVKQIGVAEVGSLAPVSALFQTGYLTVNKVTNSSKGSSLYDFRIPNEEIKPEFESIFSKGLYTVLKKEPEIEKRTFKNAVQLGEAEKVSLMFRSLLASLPSRHHRSEESFYHSVLFGYFYNMPDTILTLPEQPGAIGIPDLVVIFDDGLYVVVELKYQKEGDTELTEDNFKTTLTSLAEEGLKAIENKHYLWPYLNRAKKIVKMGVGIYRRDQVLVLMEN